MPKISAQMALWIVMDTVTVVVSSTNVVCAMETLAHALGV